MTDARISVDNNDDIRKVLKITAQWGVLLQAQWLMKMRKRKENMYVNTV